MEEKNKNNRAYMIALHRIEEAIRGVACQSTHTRDVLQLAKKDAIEKISHLREEVLNPSRASKNMTVSTMDYYELG